MYDVCMYTKRDEMGCEPKHKRWRGETPKNP